MGWFQEEKCITVCFSDDTPPCKLCPHLLQKVFVLLFIGWAYDWHQAHQLEPVKDEYQSQASSAKGDNRKNMFLDKEFRYILANELSRYRDRIFSYISRLVDLYFIRRFLDKNYITNAISYTGASHSVSFIYMLIKLGFKITHCANCTMTNIDKLNQTIDSIENFPTEKSLFELLDIFVKPDAIQCTNISDFPKNFE